MSLENPSIPSSIPNEISVKDLFLLGGKYYCFLTSKWRIILSLSLLGGLLGLAYAYWTSRYIRTTTFMLKSADGSGNFRQYAGIASMIGLDLNPY